MNVLVIIPARGGSKGIPDKNIRLLHGKPLITYTIEAALKLFEPGRILVSTDSENIRTVAEKSGLNVPFLRPAELSTDTAGSYEVILHAMEMAQQQGINFDTVILLQPTSPFRTSQHILEAMKLYDPSLDMVVSVKESDENPYYSLFEENNTGFLEKSKNGHFSRRQDCPKVYAYNGAIYIMNAKSLEKHSIGNFKNIRKYVMNSEDSIDIDTPLDWKLAELILTEKSTDRY
jgi:N-acylneuraminate cytidylyltransferase